MMRIGLEVHVALPTKTKLFCSCSTSAKEPNTSICPICMGFPGSKPMLNKNALAIALSISNALKCEMPKQISFVRKVYFYPDLPKSYQITQLQRPAGVNGSVFYNKGKVGIRRVQIEEDPAKIIREEEYTLVDFNRSGIPLVEIVTEPDITDEESLRDFISELKSILYYLGVDVEGEFKADLNISLAEQRVEIKNVTGTKNLIDATRYEIERQTSVINSGQKVKPETRSYNAEKMITESSREKESDEEYGYIFEPDLTEYDTDGINLEKPTYASVMAAEYSSKYNVDGTLIKSLIMFDKNALAKLEYAKDKHNMKTVINAVELLSRYKKDFSNEKFEELLKTIEMGAYIDSTVMNKIEIGEKIDINKGVRIEDIDALLNSILSGMKKEEYRDNKKVFNFIVGKVVKEKKANPKLVAERLKAIIDKV